MESRGHSSSLPSSLNVAARRTETEAPDSVIFEDMIIAPDDISGSENSEDEDTSTKGKKRSNDLAATTTVPTKKAKPVSPKKTGHSSLPSSLNVAASRMETEAPDSVIYEDINGHDDFSGSMNSEDDDTSTKVWEDTYHIVGMIEKAKPVTPQKTGKWSISTLTATSSEETHAAEKMSSLEDIPFDVLANVFTLLPANRVGMFFTLSKGLKKMIKSDHFLKSYQMSSLGRNQHRFVMMHAGERRDFQTLSVLSLNNLWGDLGTGFRLRVPKIDLEFDAKQIFIERVGDPSSLPSEVLPNESVSLIGSAYGLLFFATSWPSKLVFALNMTTRQIRPILVGTFILDEIRHLQWFYSFGYEPISNDFKVVEMLQTTGKIHDGYSSTWSAPRIYSFQAHGWRTVGASAPIPPYVSLIGQRGESVNGYIYWLARDTRCRDLILVFDLVKEIFSETPFPTDAVGRIARLGNYRGRLACFEQDKTRLSIWVMERLGDAESWRRMYQVAGEVWKHPIGLVGNAKWIVYHCGTSIHLYNLVTTENGQEDWRRKTTNGLEVAQYCESLVPMRVQEYQKPED